MNSRDLIDAIGGAKLLHEEFGIPYTTVHSWVARGIPYKYHSRVAELAGLTIEEVAATRPERGGQS